MDKSDTRLAILDPLWLAGLSALGLAAVALLLGSPAMHLFDHTVLHGVRVWHADWLTAVMKFFTFVGSTEAAAVIVLLAMFWIRRRLNNRREALLFLSAVASAGLFNLLLKYWFQRPRPELGLIEAGGFSFPSGHSMGAFALYGLLAYLLRRQFAGLVERSLWLLFSATMILCIGFSRVYLGVHYPSDVIGGFLSGSCLVALTIAYNRYVWRRRL